MLHCERHVISTVSPRVSADDYNWCVVPHRPWDTLLFAGMAVVVACLSQGPYSSLIVLVAGGLHSGQLSTVKCPSVMNQQHGMLCTAAALGSLVGFVSLSRRKWGTMMPQQCCEWYTI
jgi:hypothetical protein